MSEPEHLGGKRAESARLRRAEQLRRWKGSLTEQEPVAAGGGRGRHRGAGGSRVRFEEGAVFLAACSSGDTEEVKRLLGRGARVDTTNVDGLTALHQVPAAGTGMGGVRGGSGGSPRGPLSSVRGPGGSALASQSCRLRVLQGGEGGGSAACHRALKSGPSPKTGTETGRGPRGGWWRPPVSGSLHRPLPRMLRHLWSELQHWAVRARSVAGS